MAFDRSKFELLAGGGKTISLWGYKTADAPSDIDTAGYFNAMSQNLQVGDRINAQAVESGGTVVFGTFVVNANSGGVVDVADMTALTATDTD